MWISLRHYVGTSRISFSVGRRCHTPRNDTDSVGLAGATFMINSRYEWLSLNAHACGVLVFYKVNQTKLEVNNCFCSVSYHNCFIFFNFHSNLRVYYWLVTYFWYNWWIVNLSKTTIFCLTITCSVVPCQTFVGQYKPFSSWKRRERFWKLFKKC